MKNKLTDLNNHLFAQLERLGEEDISPENLQQEIERSKAITAVAREIVSNAALCLEAHKAMGKGVTEKVPDVFALEHKE